MSDTLHPLRPECGVTAGGGGGRCGVLWGTVTAPFYVISQSISVFGVVPRGVFT